MQKVLVSLTENLYVDKKTRRNNECLYTYSNTFTHIIG